MNYLIFNLKKKKYLKDITSKDSHLAKTSNDYSVKIIWTDKLDQAMNCPDSWAYDFVYEHRGMKLDLINLM